MTEMGKSLTFVGTAIVILAVALLARPRTIEYTPSKMVGKALFEFDVLDAKQLKIIKFDEERAKIDEFEVAQTTDGRWTIPSKNGYPADARDQMVDAATLVSGCKVLFVPSLDAADHGQLGVIDPASPNLTVGTKGVGIHLTMQGSGGELLADLIIGDEVKDAPKQRYVRKAGQDVTYIVEIDPTKLSTRFEDWIEKDLLKLNPWDIKTIELKDYKLEQMLTPNGLTVMIDGKSEMTLSYNNTDAKWLADSLRIFSLDEKKYVDAPLAEDEELNNTKLNDLKNSLDDLKIVDIERKPEGLSRDLQASEDFVKSNEAVMSLASRGFLPSRGEDGKIEILSTDGECICTMKNGVEYVIRFGDLRSATSDQAGQKKEQESEEKAEAPKDSLHRYLFVMARFNEGAIEKPEIKDLPSLPSEETPSEAESGGASGGSSPSPPDTPEPNNAATPEPASEDPPEVADPVPPAPAAGENPQANNDSGNGTNNRVAAAEDGTEPTMEETKTTEANAADTGTPAPDAASNPESDAENTEDKSELEKAIEDRKTIETENQKKLDEYQEKIQEGKTQVKDLNDRFGNWYYVIDDNVYKKIHLGREDVIQKKEPEKKAEEDSTKNEPVDAAGFGQPGEPIPGLPNVPETTEGTTAEGEVIEGEIPEGKVNKSEVTESEVTEGEVTESEDTESEAANE